MNRAGSARVFRALSRRSTLLVPLFLATCSSEAPAPAPASFDPLHFDYLTPIDLNVSSIGTEQQFVPGPGDLGAYAPVPPIQALRQMAQDRLHALGPSGRAVFVILDASIVRAQGSYIGDLAARLDVYASDGTRAGFAEARASRTRAIDSNPIAPTLYEMTKALMESMNVEFEYQVRRSLRDWLIVTPAPAPPPVEEQPLPSPSE
jgi:hypothetical protein